MSTIKTKPYKAELAICGECGSSFKCKSSKAKWCSTSCKGKQYDKKYPEKVAAQRLAWQRANKDKIKEYRQISSNKIAANLRSRLAKAIGRKQKTVSMLEYLGCTLDEVRLHLESQFAEDMTWDNYGKWHIDHREPLSKFDLSDPEQIKIACRYTNLQPLWAFDNQSKGDKNA